MPNWAGSCWYHLAFAFWDSERVAGELAAYKKRTKKPYTAFWKEVVKPALAEWLPVDWYLGGAEHAVLHLLYARFWSKVLQDLGYVEFSEPYLRLRSVGMVLAADGRKMSKSWGNIVNPDEMVGKYGSDAVRLYEMFMGPWDQAISWDERSLVGMKRFIERVGATYGQEGKVGKETSVKLALQLARLIKRVERGIVEQKFNTAIAGMMELVNSWRNEDLVLGKREARMLAQVMAPFAPKLAQKMWRGAGGKGEVASSEWPSLEVREVTAPVAIAVQVNGKLRAVVEVAGKEANNESQVMEVVMANEKVKKWLKRKIKRRIFVPGKLVSLVEERG
jgi:leucyl-tRNA synthetase